MTAVLQLCLSLESAIYKEHHCYTALTSSCYFLFWVYPVWGPYPEGLSDDLKDETLPWDQHFRRYYYLEDHPLFCDVIGGPVVVACSSKQLMTTSSLEHDLALLL